MPNNILLNYASGRFLESQMKNSQLGLAAGFNVVYKMSDKEIDQEFYSKHSEILNSKRGAGYWLWKPYFMSKIIKTMSKDDILFYIDSGTVFVKQMGPIFDKIRNDEKGAVCFSLSGKHMEKLWTKRDLFLHMEMNDPKYTETPQRAASFIGLRNTQFTRDLLDEYMSLATNVHLINDEPNTDGWIEPGFNEHRHDQSIWSMLSKKQNLTVLPDPTQWGLHHKETTDSDYYIFHTRDPK
jgi:hypothetical protein